MYYPETFSMLLAGLILAGFASGADLPISLTVISHDTPDGKNIGRTGSFDAGILADWCFSILSYGVYCFKNRRCFGRQNCIWHSCRLCGSGIFYGEHFRRNLRNFTRQVIDIALLKAPVFRKKFSFTRLFKGAESKNVIFPFFGMYHDFLTLVGICWQILLDSFRLIF